MEIGSRMSTVNRTICLYLGFRAHRFVVFIEGLLVLSKICDYYREAI